MSNMDRNSRAPDGDDSQRSENGQRLEQSQAPKFDRPSMLAPLIEGVVTDVLLVELGVCDPDIIDHLTEIEIDSISQGNLMPSHPKLGHKVELMMQAIELGEDRTNFDDSYAFVEFQESIGRALLYSTTKGNDPYQFFPEVERSGLRIYDLSEVGRRSYALAALEAFGLMDIRTGLLHTIAEHFEVCQIALRRVHAHFL